MKPNFLKPVHRALVAGIAGVWVLLAAGPGLAATPAGVEADGYSERLVSEFSPLVGTQEDTEALVNSLRSGQAAGATGAASVAPATGPLSYGEARLALKLAQGTLAQNGVTQPSGEQLQAALHGGTLETANGPKVLPGVLPQRAQGASWGSMAQGVGMSVEDLIPPRSVTPKKTSAHLATHAKKSGKKVSKKNAKASSHKTGKAAAKRGKAKPAKKAAKR
jgi:hypothetical protein